MTTIPQLTVEPHLNTHAKHSKLKIHSVTQSAGYRQLMVSFIEGCHCLPLWFLANGSYTCSHHLPHCKIWYYSSMYLSLVRESPQCDFYWTRVPSTASGTEKTIKPNDCKSKAMRSYTHPPVLTKEKTSGHKVREALKSASAKPL